MAYWELYSQSCLLYNRSVTLYPASTPNPFFPEQLTQPKIFPPPPPLESSRVVTSPDLSHSFQPSPLTNFPTPTIFFCLSPTTRYSLCSYKPQCPPSFFLHSSHHTHTHTYISYLHRLSNFIILHTIFTTVPLLQPQ